MKKCLAGKINTSNLCSVLVFAYLMLYPLFSTGYKTSNMVSFFYQTILAFSLVLIWGQCGLFSFGQAAFFGIGGYTYAVLILNIRNAAWSPAAMLAALAAGFLAAWSLGYFLFYGGVKDEFLGVITLCFTVACSTFMTQTSGDDWKIGRVRLGGFNGINRIPTLHLGTFRVDGLWLYYFVLLLLLAFVLILTRLKKRPLGYALVGLRENSKRSNLLGYHEAKIKTLTFAVGGAIAALAGVLYTMWGGYMVPSSMNMTAGTIPVVLSAAGGRKNPTAVLLFSLLYLNFSQRLAVNGSQYAYVLLGAILVAVVMLVPDGLIHSLFQVLDQKVFHIDSHGI